MSKYRENAIVEMRPVFISLGLPSSSFVAKPGFRTAPFDAGTNCGPVSPECIWLLRDQDVYRFNLRTRKVEEGPLPLTSLGTNWPSLFGAGVDAAVWAGPKYPDLHYFFRGPMMIRRNNASGTIDTGPSGIVVAGFGSVQGSPLSQSIAYGFPSLATEEAGLLYLGLGDDLVLHNLNNGMAAGAPITLSSLLDLPSDWQTGVDVTFFGVGDEASLLYLFRDREFACFDTRGRQLIEIGTIIERFPALAPFVPSPQIFAIEEYTLSTFCGEPTRGEYISEVTILPKTKTTVTVITETTISTSAKRAQSILQSQTEESAQKFNNEVQEQQESQRSSESYRYNMNSKLHGEVSANGVWGGELDASLDVSGGSNDNREQYAQSALSTVSRQVNQSNQELSQKVVSGESATSTTERTVKSQEQTVDNSGSDQTLTVRFFRVVQPTLSVLSLKGVSIAYSDGRNPMQTVDLSKTGELLSKCLIDEVDRKAVVDALTRMYTNVLDYERQPRSLLDPDRLASGQLRQRSNLRTTYKLVADGGDISVEVEGIAVSGRRFALRMPEATAER